MFAAKIGTSGCVDGKSTITTVGSGGVLAAVSTIPINAIAYTLFKGTVINISDGVSSETATLNADAPAGQTFVVVNAPLAFAHSAGVKIQWSQQFGSATLCSGLLVTIQETDSGWSPDRKCIFGGGAATSCTFVGATQTVGGITPTDLTGSLWSGSPSGGNPLQAGMSRFLTINVQAPATMDNDQQNRSALFDLVWEIDS